MAFAITAVHGGEMPKKEAQGRQLVDGSARGATKGVASCDKPGVGASSL